MTDTEVFFATNRKPLGKGFGGDIITLDPISPIPPVYARATVVGIDLRKENSGTLGPIRERAEADFKEGLRSEIVAGAKNLLIFIHGFANSFEASIKRAAFNREWFAAGGFDAAVVAFSWPSSGKTLGRPPLRLPEHYLSDETIAGKSGYHLAYFLKQIERLARDFRKRQPTGRVVLLAHSMGAHALRAGLEEWFNSASADEPIFNAAVLAAPDEVMDAFERGTSAGLDNLRKIAQRIAIYYSRQDIAMTATMTVHHEVARLGHNGPRAKTNTTIYPQKKFRLVDCTDVTDLGSLTVPVDATHQYYRRSPTVRKDIAGVFGGSISQGGIITLSTIPFHPGGRGGR